MEASSIHGKTLKRRCMYSSGAGVPGSCGQPCEDAGHQTWVLWKTNTCSSELSHLSIVIGYSFQ